MAWDFWTLLEDTRSSKFSLSAAGPNGTATAAPRPRTVACSTLRPGRAWRQLKSCVGPEGLRGVDSERGNGLCGGSDPRSAASAPRLAMSTPGYPQVVNTLGRVHTASPEGSTLRGSPSHHHFRDSLPGRDYGLVLDEPRLQARSRGDHLLIRAAHAVFTRRISARTLDRMGVTDDCGHRFCRRRRSRVGCRH